MKKKRKARRRVRGSWESASTTRTATSASPPGEKFAIVGGSEETHERMTETVVKTFEELKQRGKQLEQVEPKELVDILHKSTPR